MEGKRRPAAREEENHSTGLVLHGVQHLLLLLLRDVAPLVPQRRILAYRYSMRCTGMAGEISHKGSRRPTASGPR